MTEQEIKRDCDDYIQRLREAKRNDWEFASFPFESRKFLETHENTSKYHMLSVLRMELNQKIKDWGEPSKW